MIDIKLLRENFEETCKKIRSRNKPYSQLDDFSNLDKEYREKVMRNHTAAHILQAALRKVLGNHCEQAGQLVNENRVRFDFTHFSPLSAKELGDVEQLCNKEVLRAMPVETMEMPIDEAKKMGAKMT